MKKLIVTLAMAGLASLVWSPATHGQTPDPKIEWAKVVALQQGPELDRLVAQIAGRTAQDLIAKWGPKLEASVPKAKQKKASEDLNAELKYTEDTSQLIGKQVSKVSADALFAGVRRAFHAGRAQADCFFFRVARHQKIPEHSAGAGNPFRAETSRSLARGCHCTSQPVRCRSAKNYRRHARGIPASQEMTRPCNFSADPATLPEEVLQQAAAEMLDWHGSGMSVMEMSHRGKESVSIYAHAQADFRELMAVPKHVKILFTQGGDLAENAIVPLQLKRHKSVGGVRASISNAVPLAGVAALVDYLQEFGQGKLLRDQQSRQFTRSD